MILETGLLILLVVLYCIFLRKRPRRFPPGPLSWPIVGNLAQVGMEPYTTVMSMRKTYGDIIGIDLGMQRTVFINEINVLKEAFSMPVFSGRPQVQHVANPESGQFRGIVFTSGNTSIEQRRFAFTYIQSGFRNGVPVETLIWNEANELKDSLKSLCGKAVPTSNIFNIPFINSMWTIIAGERYNIQDEKYLKLLHHIENITSSPETTAVLIFFPYLSKLFPKLSGYDKFLKNAIPIYKFAEEIVENHLSTYQEGVERDFVDHYLHKMQSTTDPESSFFKKTGTENLYHTIIDLFGGGTENVSVTLRWLVFLMAKYPEAQEKLNSAIVNHRQRNENITLKDRKRLPYVEAVILEVLRFSPVGPMGVPHETLDDVEFHGYLIPKGTMVFPNVYGIQRDPKVWGDPENFRPERFLKNNETEVTGRNLVIAFAPGKRVCPGESLAKDELFIFTVMLFESFKIEFDPNEPIPPMKHVLASVLLPPEHKVVFKSRVL